MTEGPFIGIDVGGTKIVTAVLERGEYRVLDPVPTRTESTDALVAQLLDQIGGCDADGAKAVAVSAIRKPGWPRRSGRSRRKRPPP